MYSLDLLPKECHVVQPSIIPLTTCKKPYGWDIGVGVVVMNWQVYPDATFITFERQKK